MLRAFVTHRITWALAGLLVLAVVVPAGLVRSEAAFVAGTTNPGSLFSSAASFNTVSVTLTDPGTPLRGTLMLNAVATSDRGISSVVFETSPAGAGTWTTVCTDNVTPYSCSWDTTATADGLRDIRAVATDAGGYTRTDTVVNRRVDNTAPTATTTDPGSPLTGGATVSGVGFDGGSGVASTTLQYRPSGGGSWTDICTQAGATATCAWNTASLADGLYDVRTVATDAAGNIGASAAVSNRRLDNVAPTATLTAPAANLTGSITLQSTSADAANGTGVSSVQYQYKPVSSGTWTTACSSATTPFSCSFNTGAVSDGLYDFRAIATDGVGKTGTSAAVTSRRIDNTDPTVTLTAPAANLAGSVALASTPADGGGSGVASVRYEYKLSSGSTWSTACSSSTSPFTCSFDTTSVSDGLYDVRAVATDNVGRTGTSAAVTSRRIDNTDPSVTLTAPAANLTASVTLASTPTDGGGSGIASVRYEYKPSSGSTWTTACSSATTPFSCAFNTASVADGLYDFRAVATDNVSRTGTSAAVTSRRIDNTDPTVTMTAPAANLGGSVTLASVAADAGSGVASVQYQYKPTSGSTWTNACAGGTTPFSCAFDTSPLTDGLYDFRAIATDNVGRTATSAAVTSRRVDNTAPATVTLAAVGTPLTGNVNFSGTATDNGGGSGMAGWTVQYSPAGTSTWTDLCSDNGAPYACTGNVDSIADGLYDFRAVATDNAGNTRNSTVQTNRRIDTAGPTVAITSPTSGSVKDTITLTGTATDPVGVTSTTFQYRQGAGAWLTICTDATPAYTCGTIDTNGVPDGTYELRMQATDTLGHTSTSATVAVIVDNTSPTATNVQAANGGTLGRVDAGDIVTFTWSEPMAPASILAGWNGGSQAVRIRLTDGGTVSTLDLYNAAGTTRLNVTNAFNRLRLNADYANGTVWLNGTMTMSGNSLVVTVGSLISGTIRTGVTTTSSMVWFSSNAATDAVGNNAAGNTVTETGATDRDF